MLIFTSVRLSLILDRKARTAANLAFSVDDIGPSGKNQTDTWARMLQMVDRVTPDISELIVKQYPSVQSLWRPYQQRNPADARSLLQNMTVNCINMSFCIFLSF